MRTERRDDRVADGVAIAVVDPFEMVEIGDHQRHRTAVVEAAAERRSGPRLEPAAVEQARQIVVIDLAAQLGNLVDRHRNHQADRGEDRHHCLRKLRMN